MDEKLDDQRGFYSRLSFFFRSLCFLFHKLGIVLLFPQPQLENPPRQIIWRAVLLSPYYIMSQPRCHHFVSSSSPKKKQSSHCQYSPGTLRKFPLPDSDRDVALAPNSNTKGENNIPIIYRHHLCFGYYAAALSRRGLSAHSWTRISNLRRCRNGDRSPTSRRTCGSRRPS